MLQVDLIALDDRVFVAAFNNATGSRSFLTLAASCDGHQWQRVAVLEDDPVGSFSYPTLQDLPSQVSQISISRPLALQELWLQQCICKASALCGNVFLLSAGAVMPVFC